MKTETKTDNVIVTMREKRNHTVSPYEKKIENHRAAAAHLEAAATHHREAARHYAVGDYEKAHQSAFYAQGHHNMAGDYVKEEAFTS